MKKGPKLFKKPILPQPGFITRPPRVVIYCRVSTKDQAREGTSLDTQEAEARKFYEAKYKDTHDLGEVFREAESAASVPLFERTLGKKLPTMLQRNDVVIFAKLDRVFRNARDGLNSLGWMQEQDIRVVVMNFQGNLIDFSNPMGKLFLTQLLAWGEFERSCIIERLVAGQMAARAAGKWRRSMPPYGMRRPRKGAKTYVPWPAQRAFVQEVMAFLEQTGLKLGSDLCRKLMKERKLLFYNRAAHWELYYKPTDPPDTLIEKVRLHLWIKKEKELQRQEALGMELQQSGLFKPKTVRVPPATEDVIELTVAPAEVS
jgi:DNA invertase Pin-like site-specific DNA recombinase